MERKTPWDRHDPREFSSSKASFALSSISFMKSKHIASIRSCRVSFSPFAIISSDLAASSSILNCTVIFFILFSDFRYDYLWLFDLLFLMLRCLCP